jgi:hypothetical protein
VRAMGLVVAVVATLAAVVSPAATRAEPQTVWFTPPHGTIAAFAQDGTEMAWFAPGRRGCSVVRLRSTDQPASIDLPSQTARNVTCHFVRDPNEPVQLAVAEKSGNVLWTLPLRSPLALDYVLGAGVAPAQRAEVRLLEAAHTGRGVGQWLGGIAGNERTLAFAVTSVGWTDEADCLAGNAAGCALVKSGGGVYVVHGRSRVHVPGTSPAVEVATSGDAIAYVPTGAIEKNGRPRPSADLPIDIVTTRTGRRIASIVPQGVPLAIAMSPHVLATLEQTPLGVRLAWYDPATGHARGSVPVPRTTARSLTASDQLVVFHVGRSLRAVDVPSHRVRVLATAAATPVGVSIEGGRLAWAENLRSYARIRALYVNGRG